MVLNKKTVLTYSEFRNCSPPVSGTIGKTKGKMNKKVCVMTGATGMIGTSITRMLLESGEYEVILLVRNKKKGDSIVSKMKKIKGAEISYHIVELSLKKSIEQFRDNWNESKPVHCIINGACAVVQKRMKTKENIELTWATNVLSYYHLVELFKDLLIKSSTMEFPSRVINIASYYAGGLNLNDVELEKGRFNPDDSYKRSKQANRMVTFIQGMELKEKNVVCVSCHPGVVGSAVLKGIFGSNAQGNESADDAAKTPTWLALNQKLRTKHNGKFFRSVNNPQNCHFCSENNIKKLKEILKQY